MASDKLILSIGVFELYEDHNNGKPYVWGCFGSEYTFNLRELLVFAGELRLLRSGGGARLEDELSSTQ